ncbi:hypothetical protein J1605_010928, partial [Eschrichtius robustus]
MAPRLEHQDPSTLPPILAVWGVGARLRRGRGLLERSPVPAERAQKHPSSSQSLISKPILRSKEPALPGEMAASRAGAGNTQGKPGASCSARKMVTIQAGCCPFPSELPSENRAALCWSIESCLSGTVHA